MPSHDELRQRDDEPLVTPQRSRRSRRRRDYWPLVLAALVFAITAHAVAGITPLTVWAQLSG